MIQAVHQAPPPGPRQPAPSDTRRTMAFEIHKLDGVTEIRLRGSLCFSDHIAFQEMMEAFEEPAGHQMVLNLAKVECVDSSGLGMFLIANEAAQRKQLKLRLESPQAEIRRVLDLGKLDRLFEIQP